MAAAVAACEELALTLEHCSTLYEHLADSADDEEHAAQLQVMAERQRERAGHVLARVQHLTVPVRTGSSASTTR